MRKTGATLACMSGLVALLALTACGPAVPTPGINDPREAENRQYHKFNLAVDKNIVRPLANSTGKIIPPEVKQGVVNFADNLSLPGSVVNNVLQLRFGKAIENTTRFVINTTVGIGGLFDPATAVGVVGKPTDFGETLYVWGVGEGYYVELPLLGPSTDRDALGKVVDYALDPMRMILPPNSRISLLAQLGSKLADRSKYSETVDSILYDSADSYAQARLLYLDHRRFNLGEVPAESSFEDPYAE
ncbi:MAG: VacJ family lipoprotein [Candidatus Saccharibacteria bacterium]|nr:VacJ family lipoprotein [Pseudorhodobacter sp.]